MGCRAQCEEFLTVSSRGSFHSNILAANEANQVEALHPLLAKVRMIAIAINGSLALDGDVVHIQSDDQHAIGISVLAQQKGLVWRLDVGRIGIVIGTSLDRGALCQSQGDIALEKDSRRSILPGGNSTTPPPAAAAASIAFWILAAFSTTPSPLAP